MKNTFIITTLLFAMLLLGCTKEEDSFITPNNLPKKNSATNQTLSNPIMIVYGNISCDLPDGKTGCQCTVVTDNDDCSMETVCEENTSFPNYNTKLNEMFTELEIQERAENNVRITEPELKAALILDGYPLLP